MARPKKPLASQTGHVTVDFQKRRAAAEEKVKVDSNEMLKQEHPDLINDDARDYWKTLTKALMKNAFYGDISVPDIVGYCNAYAMYLDSWRKLKRAKKPETRVIHQRMIKEFSEEMTRCQNRGGFSASTRLAVGEKEVQSESEQITQEFGI